MSEIGDLLTCHDARPSVAELEAQERIRGLEGIIGELKASIREALVIAADNTAPSYRLGYMNGRLGGNGAAGEPKPHEDRVLWHNGWVQGARDRATGARRS